MFAVAALAACGRIGFDGQAARPDGDMVDSADGGVTGEDAGGDAASGGTGSFGTMEIGISTQNTGDDRVWISRFMLSEAGQVSRLVAHLGTSGQSLQLRGVIYADANGTPTTLVATSAERVLPGSTAPDWVTLALAAPVALAPGMYWIGTHTSAQASIAYRSATGESKFSNDTYSDGTATTYANVQSFSMQLSIYAEYMR